MELSYDSKYNVAYLRLREKIEQIQTIRISDELCIDMASDGKIYGIELLNANEQLGMSQDKLFTFINEVDNKKTEIRI